MRCLYAICLFVLLSTGIRATVEDPELEKLLERHIEALGGRAAMQAISTLREKGKINSEDEAEKSLLLVRKLPNLIRLNITNDNIRLSVAFDGKDVWYYYERQGERVSPEERRKELEALRRDSFFWPPPAEYDKPEYHFKQLPDETIDGKTYYALEVTIDDMPGTECYYLDQSTMMLTRRVVMPGTDEEIITDYSAYRLVNGVRMPYNLVTYSKKSKPVSVTFDSIQANKGVFDSYFKEE